MFHGMGLWDSIQYLFTPFCGSKTTFLDYYRLYIYVDTPATLLYDVAKWLGSTTIAISFPSTSGLVSKALRATLDQQYQILGFQPLSDYTLKLSAIQSILEAQMKDSSMFIK